MLPKPNRDCLEVLLVFLRHVAAQSGGNNADVGNKMDTENLATVIAPCILYPRSKDGAVTKPSSGIVPAAAENAFLSVSVVRELLENLSTIFVVSIAKFILTHRIVC